jgi:large repetitive protein
LSLNPATGAITGTPTQVGTSNFTIYADDSANPNVRNDAAALSITVNPSLLSITTSALPRATAGAPYSQTLAATGGVAPYRWSIAAGSLPANLTLNGESGVLAGVVQQAGNASFTVRVTDSFGITADRPFTLETVSRIGITAHVFPIEQGQFFSSPVTVFGGRPPYQVSLLSGAPPPGIAFSTANATFSGTTSAPVGQFSVVVQAVDSLEQVATATVLFNVSVPGPAPLAITPGSLPNGVVGVAYGAQLGTSGGVPPYGFRLSQGSLPPGLTMNAAGTFSGTPSQPGAFTFGVLATDGGGRSAGQLFTVVITAPAIPLTVTPESLPGGSINQPYAANLGASGGQAPYRFNLTGDLPPGVVFTSSGALVGTPTAVGTFRFTLQVTDARNATATRAFVITILGPVEITTAALRDAVVGVPYGAQVEAAGGTPPYSFGLSGLPPGLAGAINGAISGTPTAAGTFTVTAEVTDSRGQRSSRVLSLTVVPRLTITSSPGGTPVPLGQQISGGFAATGGRPPYQWAVTSGSLPPGVGFVSATGALSGAPTAEGSFTFGVTVTDSLQNTATGSATIRVLPPLVITAATLPGGVAGTAYGASVGATGGQAPYSFSVVGGALPPGVSLGSDGSLSGTPSAAGGFGFTVQATDVVGSRSTRAFSITIGLPPVPPISFVGAPPTIQTGQQGTITVQIANVYPVPITGTLTLQFTPNANNPIDDPAVQLTSGGREVTFTIPAGQTNAQFPLDPLRFQVGTVAGQVQLQTTFTPAGGQPTPGPTITVTIPRAVPVITAASLAPGTGGFQLTVEGFSNTREVSSMSLQFNPAPGSSLETTTVTVPVTAAFNAWFSSAGSQAFGGSFRLTLPLSVTGELSAVDSVVVRLTNSVGESQPFTARRN